MSYSNSPIKPPIIKTTQTPLKYQIAFLYQISFSFTPKAISERKLNNLYKIFPKNKAINATAKTKRYILALSMFDKAEFEKTNPPTKANTMEAKIPSIVTYWACCLLRLFSNVSYYC